MAYIPETSEMGWKIKIKRPKIRIRIKNPIKAIISAATAYATGGASLIKEQALKVGQKFLAKKPKSATAPIATAVVETPVASEAVVGTPVAKVKDFINKFPIDKKVLIYGGAGLGGLALLLLIFRRK